MSIRASSFALGLLALSIAIRASDRIPLLASTLAPVFPVGMSQTTASKRDLDRIQGDSLENYIFTGGSPSASPFPLGAEGLWDDVEVSSGSGVDHGHAYSIVLPSVMIRRITDCKHVRLFSRTSTIESRLISFGLVKFLEQ